MRLLLLLLVTCLASCQRSFTAADEQTIRNVMEQQERDWDHGDIKAFMNGYAEDICFISSKRGKTCGRAQVTESYLRAYPDKASMGDLTFGIHEVLPAGPDHAWCTGTWGLSRIADTVGGGFSLLWVRSPEGWRILRDHTY